MRKNRKLLLKYLLLVSVLMLMMLLCACRVRLTNNTEVASTIEDEDGWLSEDYQMRRDLLGEPVAERPIFKGFESEDDTEDYSDMDYEPLDYDQGTIDEWDEPDDTSSSTNTNSNSGSNSGNRSSNGSSSGKEDDVVEEEEEPEPEPVIEIIVEFDANGGYVSKNYKKVVSGSTYGDLPTPKRDDKNLFFIGWFTEDGTLITSESTVESEEPLTLYAHWGQDYPFVLKLDGGLIDDKPDDISMKSEKGLYPDLPVPKKDGFHFTGWYLPDGKTKVESGQECTSKKPLKAGWVESAKYWEDRYSVASNNEALTFTFIDDDGIMIIKRDPKEGEKPDFRIVKCIGDYNEVNAGKAAEKAKAEGEYNQSVLVVPANIYDNENSMSIYRLLLLKKIYGDASTITDDEIKQAASELGVALPKPSLYRY